MVFSGIHFLMKSSTVCGTILLYLTLDRIFPAHHQSTLVRRMHCFDPGDVAANKVSSMFGNEFASCIHSFMASNAPISDITGQITTVRVHTDGCQGTLNSVKYLEHVQCKISLRYYPRGNLQITLTSPSGTRSTLLLPRNRDNFASTFDDWPFLSVHFWGEDPSGQWTLEVSNMSSEGPSRRGQGLLRKWQLIFYGSHDNPVPRSLRTPKSFTSPVPVRQSTATRTGFFGQFFPLG